MKTMLLRSAEFDISGDGRNIEGIAFEWDRPSFVTDDGRTRYLEEFGRRSADQSLRLRSMPWPMFVRHEHETGSVGETNFERSAEGLMFRGRFSDTRFAQITLDRIHELPAVSVGFRPIRNLKRSDPRGLVTVRAEIALGELSLAEVGQHEGAKVLAVRAETGTPRLDALRRRKALL